MSEHKDMLVFPKTEIRKRKLWLSIIWHVNTIGLVREKPLLSDNNNV